MKINITKAQYKLLLDALHITGTVYAVLGDMVDEKYKKRSDEIDEFEHYFLGFAKEMGVPEAVEEYDGKLSIDFEYCDSAGDDLREYEEYAMWENLSRTLAERDFHELVSEEEVKKMSREDFLLKLMSFEEIYSDEFVERGLERLHILKIDNKKSS